MSFSSLSSTQSTGDSRLPGETFLTLATHRRSLVLSSSPAAATFTVIANPAPGPTSTPITRLNAQDILQCYSLSSERTDEVGRTQIDEYPCKGTTIERGGEERERSTRCCRAHSVKDSPLVAPPQQMQRQPQHHMDRNSLSCIHIDPLSDIGKSSNECQAQQEDGQNALCKDSTCSSSNSSGIIDHHSADQFSPPLDLAATRRPTQLTQVPSFSALRAHIQAPYAQYVFCDDGSIDNSWNERYAEDSQRNTSFAAAQGLHSPRCDRKDSDGGGHSSRYNRIDDTWSIASVDSKRSSCISHYLLPHFEEGDGMPMGLPHPLSVTRREQLKKTDEEAYRAMFGQSSNTCSSLNASTCSGNVCLSPVCPDIPGFHFAGRYKRALRRLRKFEAEKTTDSCREHSSSTHALEGARDCSQQRSGRSFHAAATSQRSCYGLLAFHPRAASTDNTVALDNEPETLLESLSLSRCYMTYPGPLTPQATRRVHINNNTRNVEAEQQPRGSPTCGSTLCESTETTRSRYDSRTNPLTSPFWPRGRSTTTTAVARPAFARVTDNVAPQFARVHSLESMTLSCGDASTSHHSEDSW